MGVHTVQVIGGEEQARLSLGMGSQAGSATGFDGGGGTGGGACVPAYAPSTAVGPPWPLPGRASYQCSIPVLCTKHEVYLLYWLEVHVSCFLKACRISFVFYHIHARRMLVRSRSVLGADFEVGGMKRTDVILVVFLIDRSLTLPSLTYTHACTPPMYISFTPVFVCRT